jgi:MIP family channel proteins
MTASLLRRCVAEGIGTFILVAIGPGAAMVSARTHAFGHLGVSLAFGLAVTLIVASTGHLGGAHVNPAVTLGFWSVRRFPTSDVVPYCLAQCAGAVFASIASGWVLGDVGGYGATIPSISIDRAFTIEAVFSGLLAFVIMGVATDERTPKAIAPFAIGATVFAGALVTGPLTGGSFNPARSLGPAIVSGNWRAHWLYWAAPVVGMMIAMRLYDLLRPAGAAASVPPAVLGTEGPL